MAHLVSRCSLFDSQCGNLARLFGRTLLQEGKSAASCIQILTTQTSCQLRYTHYLLSKKSSVYNKLIQHKKSSYGEFVFMDQKINQLILPCRSENSKANPATIPPDTKSASWPAQDGRSAVTETKNQLNRCVDYPDTFGNYRVAYGNKSTPELLRAILFFLMCRYSLLTDNAVKVMEIIFKVLGSRLAESLIRSTVYAQFVAGESADDVKRVAARLRHSGVNSILCVPLETDDGHKPGDPDKEQLLNSNLDKILSSLGLASQLNHPLPMAQFRISALMMGDLTKIISQQCIKTPSNMLPLDALTEAMSGQPIDFSQLPGWSDFPGHRSREFIRGLQRLGKVKEAIQRHDVIVLIDAEYTHINPALRLLALCLMKACNKQHTKVFYTYQAYLKETLSVLRQDLQFAAANNFGLGVKLVRGAYMVAERQRARDLGYADPVHETFDETTGSYHHCLNTLLDRVAAPDRPGVRVMVASHNEDTIKYTMRRTEDLHIPKDSPHVFFGQLFGMADHVSSALGHLGYRVYKSIPYGTVCETIPYLARRAQENKAILANARRERQLVVRALKDRILLRS